MAAPVLKAGAAAPAVTGERLTRGGGATLTLTVEGAHAALAALSDEQLAALLPAGYWADSAALETAGDGMGRLTLTARGYDDPSQAAPAPLRTTFRVDMEAVDYGLEDHPCLQAARGTILKWLATDEGARADGGAYRYMDAGGELQEVQEEEALKFIAAYMAGIKTFRRYYPVVEKASLWRNPPGLNRSGRSFSGGSLPFSAGLGTFDDPPVSLNGYPSGNWYKSRDSWEEGADRAWTRTEQWTYTPDGAASDHAWIYGGGGAE